MSQTPVITSPANGATGLGPTPRLFGTAEQNHSVEIVVASYGTQLGRGVAGPDGQWAIDINNNDDQWITVQARSYVSPHDPNSYSAYSAPITIRK